MEYLSLRRLEVMLVCNKRAVLNIVLKMSEKQKIHVDLKFNNYINTYLFRNLLLYYKED